MSAFSVVSSVSPTVPWPVALNTLERRISSMTSRKTRSPAIFLSFLSLAELRWAAVRTRFSRSAPVNPAHCLAISATSRSGSIMPSKT